MSVRRIIQTFDAWSARGEPIVLGTVYDTLGSTYSKAGHRILIAANGDYQGLVSGGCLEGDLAERARNVVVSRLPCAVTYDLRDEVDELWGLGVGCNGLIRVFLQPLLPAAGYEPFAAIARCLLGKHRAAIATVIDSADPAIAPGAALIVRSEDSSRSWGLPTAAAEKLAQRCRRVLIAGAASYRKEPSGLEVLYAPLNPVPKLLVLGAGLDAIPLVGMAADLGWRVTVADHRPAYLQRGGFERADSAQLIEPDALGKLLPLDDFDAVIVMSHHLLTDRKYLAQLVSIRAPYLGVLGPPARRKRLLAELAADAPGLHARLKGPVGLDIGADSPEAIALSILAELQATLAGENRGRTAS